MILLDKNQYHKALDTLLQVEVNHLFARAVVEKHVSGKVYADDPVSPAAFHVVHPYGMSLLFGSPVNGEFIRAFTAYMLNKSGERQHVEWMQAYPKEWNDLFKSEIGNAFTEPEKCTGLGLIEVHTRANFRFNREKYRSFVSDLKDPNLSIVRTDINLFEKMKGLVVPRNFWNSAEDFISKGVGFTLVINGEPACTAYSAYIFDKFLELGIETCQQFRGKGFAMYCCSALIDYSLENGYEPVWSCRLENTPSYMLAQKLGFEPTVTLPYYRLPV